MCTLLHHLHFNYNFIISWTQFARTSEMGWGVDGGDCKWVNWLDMTTPPCLRKACNISLYVTLEMQSQTFFVSFVLKTLNCLLFLSWRFYCPNLKTLIVCLEEGKSFLTFDCSNPFCFLLIEFQYAFSILYSTNMLCLLLLSGGGWMICHFSNIQVHFVFVNWISLYFFHFL